MKLFSILNKPAVKANNKQAGIVFLEYVIMAFIVTVAVICALWWFYWHLQQMTWEVKQKLDTLKTLNCELGKPEGEQPTPAGQGFPYNITEYDIYNWNGFTDLYKYIPIEIPYPDQTVTVTNIDPIKQFGGYLDFYAQGYNYPNWLPTDFTFLLNPGQSTTISFTHTLPGPYHIGIDPLSEIDPNYAGLVSVNVTETTP